VFLLFLVLKSGVIDPRDDWLRYTSPPGQARAAVHEMRADFGGQIELIGYDLEQKSVRSGDKFPVVLYWHALAPLEENYQSFVHLARPLHVLWGQEDHLNPGGLPTTRWPLDKYVWDEYEIHVLPGTPPGEYLINVGMPSWAGGYRLIAYDEGGQVMGDSVVIGSVEVRHPRRQPAVSALGLTHEVMTAVPEGDVILLGYVQRDAQVTASDVWPVTVFWRAERKHPAARTRALVLLDADGKEVVRVSGEPLDGYYPFELWREGEIVRDPLQLAMEQYEEYLDPGPYRFGVAVSIEACLLYTSPSPRD